MNRNIRYYFGIMLSIPLLVLLAACTSNTQSVEQALYGSATTVPATATVENTTTVPATATVESTATVPATATAGAVTLTPIAQNATPISILRHLPPTPTPTPTPAPPPRVIVPVQTKPTPSPSGNGASPGNGQTGSTSAEVQAARAVFDQINTARAQAGLPALVWSDMLVNSARKHNLAMMAANQLSHQLPNEPGLGTRISQAGVKWSKVFENIGVSWGNSNATNAALSLNQDMLNEQPPNDGHRRNILSDANVIGIDVLIDTQNQKIWLTEDFARTA